LRKLIHNGLRYYFVFLNPHKAENQRFCAKRSYASTLFYTSKDYKVVRGFEMTALVKQYERKRFIWQGVKTEHHSLAGLSQPLPISE
jgi:hypothetical protein